MPDGPSYTFIGVVTGALLGLLPKVWDRLTGGKRAAADEAGIIAGGASDVTAAALALVKQHSEDVAQYRESEAKCQKALADLAADCSTVAARCEALEDEITALRLLHGGLGAE